MKHYSIYILSGLLALAGTFTSCQEDMETFDNKAFISSVSKVSTLLLKGGIDTEERILQAAAAKPMERETKLTYQAAPELVVQYNAAYYDQAIALPKECYEIPEPTAVFGVGSVKSTEVKVIFKSLANLDLKKVYVLPVSISQADISILESERTTYYIIKGAALINTVANISKNKLSVNWVNSDDLGNLEKLTVEALIRVDKFGKHISTLMGIEGQFLIRTGDNGVPDNQLQLATGGGNATDPEWIINTGEWVHVALTYDTSNRSVEVFLNGVKKGGTQTTNYYSRIDWAREDFFIGFSYEDNRYLDGNICECRVWNRILTADELKTKDHFYSVDPASDGLVAYWKFNDGEGNTVIDYTANGNHAMAASPLAWEAITLPAK